MEVEGENGMMREEKKRETCMCGTDRKATVSMVSYRRRSQTWTRTVSVLFRTRGLTTGPLRRSRSVEEEPRGQVHLRQTSRSPLPSPYSSGFIRKTLGEQRTYERREPTLLSRAAPDSVIPRAPPASTCAILPLNLIGSFEWFLLFRF